MLRSFGVRVWLGCRRWRSSPAPGADADADTEFDAIDLGAVALSWGLDGWVNATHSMVQDGWVDSMDVMAIDEAFRNAYGGA